MNLGSLLSLTITHLHDIIINILSSYGVLPKEVITPEPDVLMTTQPTVQPTTTTTMEVFCQPEGFNRLIVVIL